MLKKNSDLVVNLNCNIFTTKLVEMHNSYSNLVTNQNRTTVITKQVEMKKSNLN